jgi:hypothetical protein
VPGRAQHSQQDFRRHDERDSGPRVDQPADDAELRACGDVRREGAQDAEDQPGTGQVRRPAPCPCLGQARKRRRDDEPVNRDRQQARGAERVPVRQR